MNNPSQDTPKQTCDACGDDFEPGEVGKGIWNKILERPGIVCDDCASKPPYNTDEPAKQDHILEVQEKVGKHDGADDLNEILEEYGYAIVNHPEASRASHIRTYRQAIDRHIQKLLLERAIEELDALEFHGHGSDKQTLAAIYTHVLLSKKALQAELKSLGGES